MQPSGAVTRFGWMSHAPENRFIATLEAGDALALRPLLRRASVTPEQIMVVQGAPVTVVHFPIDCQFANLIRFPDGGAIETAVIGDEGVTGLAPFMADRPSGWEIVCRAGGDAWVVNAAALRGLAVARPRLMTRLLALTDLYQAQAAQTAACNAVHSVRDRIARWILTASDLTPYDTLFFRQEELARLIGARRTTVSEAAAQLRRKKVIAYSRGVIRIVDRPGLEAAACDCYGMLKSRLDSLYGQAGSQGDVG